MISWCIKDLCGTKVMYCYVLKILFLTPQLYTQSSCDVHLLRSPCLDHACNLNKETNV